MSTEKLEALRAQNGINGRHLFGGQNFLPVTGATISDVVLMKQGLAIEDLLLAIIAQDPEQLTAIIMRLGAVPVGLDVTPSTEQPLTVPTVYSCLFP